MENKWNKIFVYFSDMSRRGRRGRRGHEDDGNGFNAWGGYMNAKKAKLEEQFLRDRGKLC